MNTAWYRRLPLPAREDRLPSIGIARPLVEREHTRKLAQVLDFTKCSSGQVVDHLPGHESAHKARPELQPGLASLAGATKIHLKFRCVVDQPARDIDQLCHGRRKASGCGQPRSQQFVGQHPQMLRVVLELDHVRMAVGAQHQLPLRAAPHPPDVLHRQNCQARVPSSLDIVKF